MITLSGAASKPAYAFALVWALGITGCGGSSGPSEGYQGPPVTISGQVTFDLVPHQADDSGLDYSETRVEPVRGVEVQLLNSADEVLDETVTSDDGDYSLEAPAATNVRVRVIARMLSIGAPAWDFMITDNTQENGLYVLDGQLANSGNRNSIRDLHADSGWGGQSYTDVRAAAPFAILDTVYEAVERIVEVDPDVELPPLELRWSPDNRAVSGELEDGDIGTTFYSFEGSIYVLGWEDNDTDEYDRSVIAHEFGHYIEHQLGRTDSIGGSHTTANRLDMRVAFSEGWGNAFAGIATEDPVYRDSMAAAQNHGFSFTVNENDSGANGWYSEHSVNKILYNLSENYLGFAPIYQTLVSDDFFFFDGAISIYPFITLLQDTIADPIVDTLLNEEDITVIDGYGTGETNAGGSTIALPIYHQLTPGNFVEACSDNAIQEYNGFDVRRFILIDVAHSGNYQISAVRSRGLVTTDPDWVLHQAGEWLEVGESEVPGNETHTVNLAPGRYWLEVYEYQNADQEPTTGGFACFNVSVSTAP